MNNKHHIVIIYIALAAIAAIPFIGTLKNGFVYDDTPYVTENDHIQKGLTKVSLLWAFTDAHAKMWHPLTTISHIIDYELYTLNPTGHHLTNLLLHIANTLLLFCVLKMLTTSTWPSAFIAVIFAIHPVNVESVAWIAERKNVISFFFWMLTIAAYLRYTKKTNITRYLLLIATYALCITTKPMVVTLPFVLLLLDYWPLQRFQLKGPSQTSIARLIAEKIPLLLLSLLLCYLTYSAQAAGGVVTDKFTFTIRASNAILSYVKYIGKLFYPHDLAVFYPHLGSALPTQQIIASIIALICISVIILFAARTGKRKYLIVGWLWYLGTLVPAIGFVQVGAQSMADRYLYLPAIGLLIIIAWTAAEITAKFKYQKQILISASAAIIITLSLCTINQVKYFKDEITLYGHAVDVTKNNFVMTYNMGSALQKKKQNDRAAHYYQQALNIQPNSIEALNNMGRILLDHDQLIRATEYFDKALAIGPADWMARKNLAVVNYKKGNLNEAITVLEQILIEKPEWFDTYYHLGSIYLLKNNPEKTIQYWNKVMANEPDWADAANNLAWLLATYNDPKFRNPTEAVRIAEIAIQFHKQNPGVMDTLAAAYASAGRFDKAIETAQNAMIISINTGQKQLAAKIAKRIKLYKEKKAYIQNRSN